MSDSLQPYELQHASLPCLSLSWNLLKLMFIESAMPHNHLTLCCPLLLLPSIFPSIRVFSNELTLCISWPKYQGFSFNISPSSEGLTGLNSLQSKELSRVFSSTTIWNHQFSRAQPSLWSNSDICTWLLKTP